MAEVYISTYDGFNIGNTVTLNSGGPSMTVEGFEQIAPAAAAPAGTPTVTLVKCVWFNEAGGFGFRSFPSFVLTNQTPQAQPQGSKPATA